MLRFGSSLTRRFFDAFVFTVLAAGPTAKAASRDAQAVRLNNAGVALMNQQQTDRAEADFAEAFRKDPAFAEAALNDGIALLASQKVPQAKAALKAAIAIDAANARAWYNLGLVDRAANEMAAALGDFEQAAKLDPADADSWYFVGVCNQDLKQPEPAIAAFTTALEKNPQHASAEFAMARALQRSGRAPEAAPHFKQFQHLTSTKVSAALGLSYGEEGRYSVAVPYAAPSQTAPSMIAVKFSRHALVAAGSEAKPAQQMSGGSCMIDMDGDGRYDLVLMVSGPSAIRVLRNKGDGGFEEIPAAKAGLAAAGHGVACAAGDYDADGLADLAVALDDQLMLFHNLGHGQFENVTAAAGLTARNRPQGITFVDYDHDGDLDLFLTGSGLKAGDAANVLWRNNGNKAFTEWTEPTELGGSGHTTAVVLSDVNNDRAVDLAVAGDGAPTVYLNPREGKYPAKALYEDKSLAASRGITALDFNKDGWMDLAVTHAGAPGLTLWRNRDGQGFERVALPLDGVTRAWGVTPIDFDNDGWIDLAVLVETAGGARLRMLRNMGDGSFQDVSQALGLDAMELKDARGLIAMDADGDGDADLIVTSATGDPVMLRNDGGNANASLLLTLKGFADNKTGIGTKVEVFTAAGEQKWEIAGSTGYLSQGPPEVLVGLGAPESANAVSPVTMVRMLWPTGVPQDEIDVPRKPVVAYTEADRRGSSCPVLFAWNGKHFGLVTDTIGAAVVGHWFTPERRNTPRPDEWIKVDGGQLAAEKGRLSLRFTEPMEEVNYIDQLRLRAVDHPAGTEVYPDERFLDDPPFASGRTIVAGAAKAVNGAWNDHGVDVTKLVVAADHQFASDFTALPYDGFANSHTLTLDLGEVTAGDPLRLLMTGYVEYFSASSLYGAWQAGIKPISPYVEAELADGTWQRIDKEMGFPAGLERTIVVDLTGKLPAGAHRIRIVTNLQIYWDQIQVDQSDNWPAARAVHESEIPLAKAMLRFHGYPRQMDGVSPGDLSYDYDQVSLTGPFQRQRGSYTRFGDVTPLVSGVDNRFAIFGSGEEIAAEFDASKLPALPAGWTRDYFFYANGYVKDMDFYDAMPFTVSELPFHGMSAYPYPAGEAYPDDAKAMEYQLNWNDRFDSGEPSQSFRFDYEPRPSTPADIQ
jgi:tetratricopeptide (TPR) repeat protein